MVLAGLNKAGEGEGKDKAEAAASGGGLSMGGSIVGDILEEVAEFGFDEVDDDKADD